MVTTRSRGRKQTPARRAPKKKKEVEVDSPAPVRRSSRRSARLGNDDVPSDAVTQGTPAKRSTRRKTPAKKSAKKKTSAKKAPAKKAPAKKAPVKKAPAKKKTPKRAAAKKKTPARKTPKRAAAKKTPARKTPVRRSTRAKAAAKAPVPPLLQLQDDTPVRRSARLRTPRRLYQPETGEYMAQRGVDVAIMADADVDLPPSPRLEHSPRRWQRNERSVVAAENIERRLGKRIKKRMRAEAQEAAEGGSPPPKRRRRGRRKQNAVMVDVQSDSDQEEEVDVDALTMREALDRANKTVSWMTWLRSWLPFGGSPNAAESESEE